MRAFLEVLNKKLRERLGRIVELEDGGRRVWIPAESPKMYLEFLMVTPALQRHLDQSA